MFKQQLIHLMHSSWLCSWQTLLSLLPVIKANLINKAIIINALRVRETSPSVHRTLHLQKQPDAAVWNTLQLPICSPSLMKGFWQWLSHTHTHIEIHSETDDFLGSINKKTFETRERLRIKRVKRIQMCKENPWSILLLSMFSAHPKRIHSHNSARLGVS